MPGRRSVPFPHCDGVVQIDRRGSSTCTPASISATTRSSLDLCLFPDAPHQFLIQKQFLPPPLAVMPG